MIFRKKMLFLSLLPKNPGGVLLYIILDYLLIMYMCVLCLCNVIISGWFSSIYNWQLDLLHWWGINLIYTSLLLLLLSLLEFIFPFPHTSTHIICQFLFGVPPFWGKINELIRLENSSNLTPDFFEFYENIVKFSC